MISCQARDLDRAREVAIDPIARSRIVPLVLSRSKVAKERESLTDGRLSGNGLQNLENFLFQLWRDIVKRYIWPEFVVEPERGAIEVEHIAGDHQFEILCITTARLVGHMRNETAIGLGIEIATKDDLLAVAADYI